MLLRLVLLSLVDCFDLLLNPRTNFYEGGVLNASQLLYTPTQSCDRPKETGISVSNTLCVPALRDHVHLNEF